MNTGIGYVQVIGWTVTVAGTAVNLGWNAYNTWRANKQRADQYRTAQWDRIRSEIERRLDELLEAGKLLIEQVRTAGDQAPAIEILNFAVVMAQDQLASALEAAEQSPYCEGADWRNAGHGVQTGQETSWDIIIQCVAEAQAATTKPERLAALLRMRQPMNEIKTLVQQNCRAQDLGYDPTRI